MLDKYDLEKIKGGRFYSKSQKCFVSITRMRFTIGDKVIDLDKVPVTDIETQKMLGDVLYDSKTKYRMEKRKSRAFGKDIFLLGKDSGGYTVWLEEPKWDCGWYWGFGYIEKYTNKNNPSNARDIISHSHFSGLVGEQEYYDYKKGCHRKGEYIHNVYDSPELVETCFSEDEGWKLSELFKQFYLLKDMAEYTHKNPAGCHLTTSPVTQNEEKMKEWHKEINEVMIPKVTAEIMRILNPEVSE